MTALNAIAARYVIAINTDGTTESDLDAIYDNIEGIVDDMLSSGGLTDEAMRMLSALDNMHYRAAAMISGGPAESASFSLCSAANY